MSLLTGTATPSRVRPLRQEAEPNQAAFAVIHAAAERLLLSLAQSAEEAKAKALEESKNAEDEKSARAEVEARLAQIEEQRAQDSEAVQRAADAQRQELERMQASMAELRASAERLRAELLERDTETAELRRAAALAAQDYTKALADAKAAAERAMVAPEPKLIYQPPVKPESISFQTIKDANGLLRRVVLRAQGYEDVAVDIVRGADNRMRDLKIGGNK